MPIFQVKFLVPYNRHGARNTHYHLVLFHLKTPLNIETPYVRALCVHLDPRSYQDKITPDVLDFIDKWPFNWEGFASGYLFGPSKEYAIWDGKAGSREVCDSVFRYYYRNATDSAHVFCAKYKGKDTISNLY